MGDCPMDTMEDCLMDTMGDCPMDTTDTHVGIHADLGVATSEPGCPATSSQLKSWEVEVRWMATGNIVCCITATSAMCVAQVKQLIQQQAGIPVEDQCVLLDGQELPGEVALPLPVAAALLLVRSVTDPRITNLGHFRVPTDFEARPQGAFTAVRKLASGIYGDIFQYRWQREESEEHVAVKKLSFAALQAAAGTETDERIVHMEPWKKAPAAEDALAEIGVLTYLASQPDLCPHILRLRGVFAEEGFAWVVTDFADGGDLFEVAVSGRVQEQKLQRYMFQLFQALEYLHRHRIGHRDVSLENILLKEDSVRLMDFGMSVSSHSASGVPLRYFRAVGKDSYRAPEVYCPTSAKIWLKAPAGCKPGGVAMAESGTGYLLEVRLPSDAVPGRACMAEVWGYAAQPADIFSAVVCFFMLAWQCPPWKMARMADPMFAFVHSKGEAGLGALLSHWKRPLLSTDAMNFISKALQSNPAQRPSAAECLASPWLASMGEAAA